MKMNQEKKPGQLPNGWHDLTVGDYVSAVDAVRDLECDVIQWRIKYINSLLNFPLLSMRRSTVKQVQEAWRAVQFTGNLPTDFKKNVEKRIFIGLDQLTMNEFITLEHLFDGGYITNCREILAIMYRKTYEDATGVVLPQPFETLKITNHLDEVEELNAGEVMGAINAYLDHRERVKKSKGYVFEEPDTEYIKELPPEEQDAEIHKIKTAQKWGWEMALRELTEVCNMGLNEVLRSNHILMLNMLEMKRANKL